MPKVRSHPRCCDLTVKAAESIPDAHACLLFCFADLLSPSHPHLCVRTSRCGSFSLDTVYCMRVREKERKAVLMTLASLAPESRVRENLHPYFRIPRLVLEEQPCNQRFFADHRHCGRCFQRLPRIALHDRYLGITFTFHHA